MSATLFFHLVPRAAAAAWRTAAMVWRWLIAPPKGNPDRYPPSGQTHVHGLGWAGRRPFKQDNQRHGKNPDPAAD